jgi:hypothetical protein
MAKEPAERARLQYSFMDTFPHLMASPNAGSIYYADLFLIQEKGWVIGGHGKSDAGQIASQFARNCDVARDAVALVRQRDVLYGRHDAGAVHRNPAQAEPLHKIDVIAYCLSPEQTVKAFSGKPLALRECPAEVVGAHLSNEFMTMFFGSYFFSEQELAVMQDPMRRVNIFLEVTDGIPDIKFLIVPFMPTVEEKAALYTSFFP